MADPIVVRILFEGDDITIRHNASRPADRQPDPRFVPNGDAAASEQLQRIGCGSWGRGRVSVEASAGRPCDRWVMVCASTNALTPYWIVLATRKADVGFVSQNGGSVAGVRSGSPRPHKSERWLRFVRADTRPDATGCGTVDRLTRKPGPGRCASTRHKAPLSIIVAGPEVVLRRPVLCVAKLVGWLHPRRPVVSPVRGARRAGRPPLRPRPGHRSSLRGLPAVAQRFHWAILDAFFRPRSILRPVRRSRVPSGRRRSWRPAPVERSK
jgi:hypothetical protein